jgi:cardiolipin synthase
VIFTIPNLISFARILLVPLFVWLVIARDGFSEAAILLGFIGATDWIDGYLARRLGQVSEVGKALDPIADRLAVAAAVIVGWVTGALPWSVAALLVVRESVVGIGALVLAARTGRRLVVRRTGKIATFGLYFALPSFFLAEGTGATVWSVVAWVIVVPSLLLYYVVAARYLADMRAALRPVSSDTRPDTGDPG